MKGTIIVVEDDPHIAQALVEVLADEGYLMLPVSNGTVAVELIRKVLPLAVTIDLRIPGLSGEDMVKSLKADPQTAGIPLIIISAHLHSASPQVRLLADASLSKPFDLDVLVNTVSRAITA